MDGLTPFVVNLTDTNARTMGQQMQTGLTPFLVQMNEIMRRRTDQLSQIGFGVMTLALGTLSTMRGLRADVPTVQVLNLDFLELMAAVSFAFIVLIFLKLYEMLHQLYVISSRLNRIIEILGDIRGILLDFKACACSLLAQIHQDLTDIAFELTAIGNSIITLLQAILNELRKGINVTGTIVLSGAVAITVTISGGGGGGGGGLLDNISIWDLLKLLGILAMLVGFVYALGYALKSFTLTSVAALAAIAYFISSVIPLIELLGKLSGWDILGVVVGLAALAGFVYVLAYSLKGLSIELLEALPKLSEFIEKLMKLADALAKMSGWDIAGMVVGLAALAGFVYVLGVALSKFTAEVLKALPGLGEFLDKLGAFATSLAKLSGWDIAGMVVGLAALSGFVYVLGLALSQFTAEALAAMPKLGEFIDHLGKLASMLAKLSAGDIAGMVVGLAALSGFVYVLGLALSQFTADVLKAMPGLSEFIENLTKLGTTLAGLSAGDIAGMVVGLAALAGFVYVLGLALAQLSPALLMALPNLTALIDSLGALALLLAGFGAWDLVGMAVGLGLLAGFVYVLGMAINQMGLSTLLALPYVTDLIRILMELAVALAGMGVGELIAMAVGLALLAGFVFALAFAVEMATPGLIALQGVLSSLEGAFDTVASAASGAWDAISSVPDVVFGGVSDLLPSFQEGGIMPHTGLALVHEGETIIPAGGSGGLPLAQPVDQSVNIQGGITVNVSAEHMDSAAVPQVTDEIVRQLQARLSALRVEQDFRTGVRTPAPA